MRQPEPQIALGRSRPAKRGGIRPGIFYGLVGALLVTNALSLVCFLMSPDIAGLLDDREERIAAAYQDRIVHLRLEVDRLHSRQYAQAGDMNLQMQELVQQQHFLAEQQQYVRALADKAEELGILTADTDTPKSANGSADTSGDVAAAESAQGFEAVRDEVHQMMGDTRTALSALSEATTSSTQKIVDELGNVGIKPSFSSKLPEAVGGPYEPISDIDPDSLVQDANAVSAAFTRFSEAKSALADAPVHKPLKVAMHVSSPFGPRKDPFTGSRAYHSGIDYPAPTGTKVYAAGAGKVSFAGRRGGYGNLVEITHDDGFITRYGHLSTIQVRKGQRVATGDYIGQVGSTGRSTGPHLHFEVRNSKNAVNPAPFLKAGTRLAQFL